jgi:uncharacterized protein
MARHVFFPMAMVMAVIFAAVGATSAAAAGDGVHRLIIHVDEGDPARMKLALMNTKAVAGHYLDKGEDYEIEVLAYGPGLAMLRADISPVKEMVTMLTEAYGNVSFRACGNSHTLAAEREGREIPLLPGVTKVPSGVVHLVQRQEEGWSYVRP